ncbi:Helitron helicase [Phytophthora megakarya]|uniref:Helitron helicase n=1 Tax=Phytophthora megakarya TaxID=4795 RepID=A0A225WB94_9STRA|nr:Helitron helicase [Phytophthora megakarya]
MCIVPEERGHYRWDDEEHKESEDMEAPPNFNLLPATELPFEVGETNPDDDLRERSVNALIDAVYPGVGDDNLLDEYFVDRAILAPTNTSVRRINEMVAERLTGETKEYLSVDSLEGVADPNMFEQEFLNSLNFSGIPRHRIVLKVGTPIIMIRNFNSDAGLCNGTRLRVVSLRERHIEATSISGPFTGKTVFIPRIIFYSEDDDKEFPIHEDIDPIIICEKDTMDNRTTHLAFYDLVRSDDVSNVGPGSSLKRLTNAAVWMVK